MIRLGRFCCICLKNGYKLEKLSTQRNGLSFYEKLSMLIPQLDIDEIKEVVSTCEECRMCIDNMYDFHETCLRNNITLWKYIKRLRTDQNGTFPDSFVLNKSNETQFHGCGDDVNDLKLIHFENIHIKTESIDERVSPTNELNNEQRLENDDPLNIDIKSEVPDDHLYENNSIINTVKEAEIHENKEVKTEDISSLHTEFDIKHVKNEKPYDDINTQSCRLKNSDATSNKETDVDLMAERNEPIKNTDKPSENIDDNTRNILIANRLNNNKIRNEFYNDPVDVEVHNETHSGGKSLIKSSSNEHVRIHTGEKPYECEVCNKPFTSASQSCQHQKNHSGDKPYKCEICNKSFTKNSNLTTHKKIHTSDKPHKCETCNKSFARVSNLNVHSRVHTGDKPYKCEICNKSFTQSSQWNYHNKIHSGEKLYKCDVCNKSFITNFALKNHIRIHTGDKPHTCEVCNKSFVHNCDLKRHIRTHNDELSYKCETCNKSFTHLSSLNVHNRIHTGDKPYKCETCNKSFTQWSTLNEHIRIHTGEKPYKCEICNNCFTRSSQLYQHRKTHSVDKPHKCDTCNKSFMNSNTLRIHNRIHTGDILKCEVCNKSFSFESSLKRHMKNHS